MEIKRYYSFEGMSSRTEYWGVYIASCLGMMIALALAGFFAIIELGIISYVILCVTAISIVWISIATLVKRCRDIGISPLFSFAMLIPTVNIIVLIVFGCLPSKTEQHGFTRDF